MSPREVAVPLGVTAPPEVTDQYPPPPGTAASATMDPAGRVDGAAVPRGAGEVCAGAVCAAATGAVIAVASAAAATAVARALILVFHPDGARMLLRRRPRPS